MKPTRLIVRTSPWCDLSVDGKTIGRTPQTLTTTPGKHALVCLNPSGAKLEREVDVEEGQDRIVEAPLRGVATLSLRLSRGDAIRLDDDAAGSGPRSFVPGRRRVALLKDGQVLEERTIDLPASGCRLVDTPSLRCENP